MRYIDIDNWSRKNLFHLFNHMDYPYLSLGANVDVTATYHFAKEHGLSFFKTVLYISARAANSLPEFRYRIRGEEVVEHDVVHPSFTVLNDAEAVRFCTVDYQPDFAAFYAEVERKMDPNQLPPIIPGDAQDDLLFITCIPWVSFTDLNHPVHCHPADSVPRISWGKYFTESTRLKMPLHVQANHAVLDGLHLGRYFLTFQELLDHPEDFASSK